MSEIKETTQDSEVDATRATARLPGLEIEVVHRRSPSGDAEQISINLQAVPSFEAFGRFIETAWCGSLGLRQFALSCCPGASPHGQRLARELATEPRFSAA